MMHHSLTNHGSNNECDAAEEIDPTVELDSFV